MEFMIIELTNPKTAHPPPKPRPKFVSSLIVNF